MARRVKWSNHAWLDLEDAADFIMRDSPFYAATFVREMRDAARTLKTFAERGRVVPEFGDQTIREIFVRSYRLIYQIRTHEVYILGVIYGSRDLQTLWVREGR